MTVTTHQSPFRHLLFACWTDRGWSPSGDFREPNEVNPDISQKKKKSQSVNCEKRPARADTAALPELGCGAQLPHKPAHLHPNTDKSPPSHHHNTETIKLANCHLTPPRHSHLTWSCEASSCPLRDVTKSQPGIVPRGKAKNCAIGRPASVWLASGCLPSPWSSVSRLPALPTHQP